MDIEPFELHGSCRGCTGPCTEKISFKRSGELLELSVESRCCTYTVGAESPIEFSAHLKEEAAVRRSRQFDEWAFGLLKQVNQFD